MPNGHYPRHAPRRPRDHQPGLSVLAAGVIAVASGALAYAAVNRFAGGGMSRGYRPSWPEDAPRHTLSQNRSSWRGPIVVGRTVTINKPRNELYAFWRDFTNLPKFMENVKSVSVAEGGRRSHWTIAGPGGNDIEFDSTIVEERENEMIAWRSDADATVHNSGRIIFRDAPGGRGTEVEAIIAYKAPGGRAGQVIAKLFQREPHIQARRELKRFKQLMETGEIATTVPGKAAPRA